MIPAFLRLNPSRVLHAVLLMLLATGSACSQSGQSASLDGSDPTLQNGEHYDVYDLDVEAGQWIEVEMTSSDFDTYLALVSPSYVSEQNDDYDGSQERSYIRLQASESGRWRVYATSYEGGETGRYAIAINVGDGSRRVCADCDNTVLATANTGQPAETAPQRRIERGRLQNGDATLSSGEFYDTFTVEGRAGERLVLDLRATEFDPYLILKLSDDEQLDNDDYEGDRTRSMIVADLPADGTYRVLVTSYSSGETGAYDLTIQGVGGEAGSTASAAGVRTENGALASSDRTLRTGEYVDVYTFEGVPGQRLRLDLESDEFDTYLGLQPPRGDAMQDDDGGGSTGHSVIEHDLTEPGTYQVYVTSYEPKEEGAYRLTMRFDDRFGDSAEGTTVASATETSMNRQASLDTSELTLDESIRGDLAQSDRRLESGEFVDLHVFDGEAGEPVRIELTSTDFDTYLIVTTPAGEIITNDDYDGSTNVSRVEMVMPMDGRYRIEATSYAGGETGRYALRISQLDAMQPDPPEYDRIVGLFVGISDYGGRIGNLIYTAEDANLIRDALVQGAGMRPEDGIVLTDARATRAGVRQAIADLAARTDENTLFVLFFSGHGGQYERAAGPQITDPDGLDESIELYDGEILDDELNRLLGQLRANHQLIVLDACYSGGFAKDVISAPGRMGLFSSEEDVVSAVASKFEAGGYLSRFFSDALVARDADEDGNRALTPIELSEYLRERYRGDVRNTGLEAIVARETRPGHQHLVVDRGSLGAFSTLFVLR